MVRSTLLLLSASSFHGRVISASGEVQHLSDTFCSDLRIFFIKYLEHGQIEFSPSRYMLDLWAILISYPYDVRAGSSVSIFIIFEVIFDEKISIFRKFNFFTKKHLKNYKDWPGTPSLDIVRL